MERQRGGGREGGYTYPNNKCNELLFIWTMKRDLLTQGVIVIGES